MMLAAEDEMVVGMASGGDSASDKLQELWINEVEWRIARGNGLAQRLCRVCLIGPLGETCTAWLLMDADNKAAARSYAKVEPAARSAPAVMLEWSL